ncbi:MAG: insulinase family protein, partial [Fimbriimonadaceae bacterium]|nr:insulinase family protein [Chitinophagales bacterium]
MEVINRIIQPDLKNIEQLRITNYKKTALDNGVPLYIVDGVEEDLVRIELRFPAGRWYETIKGHSHAVAALMKKGTATKSSLQIAEAIEFYGAQVETSSGIDTTSVTLFILGKHLNTVLPIISEILNEAIFPEDEIVLYKERKKQRLRINSQNTDFHANRKFNEVLFGNKHPYGYAMDENDIDAITREQVVKLYKENYSPGNAQIFVSGNVPEKIITTLNREFGNYPHQKIPVAATDKSIYTNEESEFYIQRKDSVQSSVRIGCISISKHHPDFPELNVLNTIFGGYFGSRLMSNIRENKGYTYGIHSYITHLKHASYFAVDTEVGNEVCKNAIAEVYKEMDVLKSIHIDAEELNVVKNYMLGTLLRATDGPFN